MKQSMWSLGGMSWKELALRVWREMTEDDVWGRAAQLSYYFLLALFPLLLFLTSLLGYFAESGTELRNDLLNYLAQLMPGSAYDLVFKTVDEISKAAGGGKLSFGILATLWAASNGMGAITESLNAAYGVKEGRTWWKVRLISIGLTIAISVLVLSALALLFYGNEIGEATAKSLNLSNAFAFTFKVLRWPILLVAVLICFSLIYYFAPDLKDQDWKWVTPGAAIGLALWLLVSFAFRLYLHFFNSYSATYGSLGAVIILMLWFYLTGAAILIGGEINSEIENAEAERNAPDAKKKGEKAPEKK